MKKAWWCLPLLPACSLLFHSTSSQNQASDAGNSGEDASSEDAGSAEGLEFTWIRHLTGQDSVELNDIALSSGGDVYVAGLFQEALKFDDTTESITGGGNAEVFIGRVLSNGAGDWLVTIPAAGRASAHSLDFRGGDLVVAGNFDTSISLFGTTNSAGGNDIWWADVAPTNGGLSVLRTSGGPNADFVRGLAHLNAEPVLAASLGDQAEFFGQLRSPVGGSDIFLGTNAGGANTSFQYGASDDEFVVDMVADDSGLLLLVKHQGGLTIEGTSIQAPAADGISLIQHDGTTASSNWGLSVADLQVSGLPTMHYNSVSKTTVVAGAGQSSSAVVGGASADLANRTGWAVLVDASGSMAARILVRSDWTSSITGCVMDDGTVVIAAFVDGGTPSVEVNGMTTALDVSEPALVVFAVDPAENTVLSERAFPVQDTAVPQRLLPMSGGALTLAGWINGSLALPDGTTINAFNSGYPDSFVMRLQL